MSWSKSYRFSGALGVNVIRDRVYETAIENTGHPECPHRFDEQVDAARNAVGTALRGIHIRPDRDVIITIGGHLSNDGATDSLNISIMSVVHLKTEEAAPKPLPLSPVPYGAEA